jgi:hypothetical protein
MHALQSPNRLVLDATSKHRRTGIRSNPCLDCRRNPDLNAAVSEAHRLAAGIAIAAALMSWPALMLV